MAETLGSLCDKLTIVKLKQWHTQDEAKLASLAMQAVLLGAEIDDFLSAAISGALPIERLSFAANKVYKGEGYDTSATDEKSLGGIISRLAKINCQLWHEQEKVYEFEKVPIEEKDKVVKALAELNLMRNQCIDSIDQDLILAVARGKLV